MISSLVVRADYHVTLSSSLVIAALGSIRVSVLFMLNCSTSHQSLERASLSTSTDDQSDKLSVSLFG